MSYSRLALFCASFLPLILGAAAAPVKVAARDGWIAVAPPGARTTAAYFSLTNDSDQAIVVRDVRVAGAVGAELHASAPGPHGTHTMQRLPQLEVAAHAAVTLAPSGMHVMIFGLPALKDGQVVDLVVKLDGGAEIAVPLTARAL